MAKVYCVHLVNMLGYDLLFQVSFPRAQIPYQPRSCTTDTSFLLFCSRRTW
jgi:hypothetical protein